MKNLLKKLHKIQGLNLTFQKTEENPFYHSKYLPLEELQKKINPVLQDNGLVVFHYTKNSCVITEVADVDSGESITSEFPLQAGLDPQKVGSTITYAKRYSIGQIFNIITDEDDDANASVASPEPRHAFIPTKTMQHTTAQFGTMFCPVCKVDAAISKKTGKPYCPNFKNHEKGVYISLIPKPTENEIDFGQSLDEDIDVLKMGL